MVIDAGWQADSSPERPVGHGPWDRGNKGFPDIPGIADAIRDIGARPGIWVRPLGANPDEEDAVLLPAEHGHNASGRDKLLDPSIPEVLERISGIFSTLRGWGYEMIKHDFSTCDIFGLWGVTMKSALTMGGWHFADRSRTTAEIILDLYRAIRTGAGTALLIGCNTLSHLGAGLFDLQRTGDDTSGQAWERTRKLGVNTLAFRMAQHGTFYMADADCVGLTKKVPWDLNKQWLDLLAESGTPLFVSADPDAMGPEQSKALKRALALNAEPREPGEPLDWMDSVCPRQWKLSGKVRDFSWYGPDGVPPM
jgi:alpha-galactosidase